MHSLSEQILYLPTRLMTLMSTNNALSCNYTRFHCTSEVTELNIRQLHTG